LLFISEINPTPPPTFRWALISPQPSGPYYFHDTFNCHIYLVNPGVSAMIVDGISGDLIINNSSGILFIGGTTGCSGPGCFGPTGGCSGCSGIFWLECTDLTGPTGVTGPTGPTGA